MTDPPGSGLSMSEAHGSVRVPHYGNLFRRIFAIAGPAYLVAVGYMDPGNWATDIAAGSAFNYSLLWVLLMSNLMALLLQSLSIRLGIVRGLDLAQACRREYPPLINGALWVLCEIAITATDLAEVLGSAIALQLLFGLPLAWGVCLTATDTLLLLVLSRYGIRKVEAFIISLVTVVAGGLLIEVVFARPDWGGVATGLIPSLPGPGALYVAMGMLGATVMPHNLYLHSSLVQTRRIGPSADEKRAAIRFNVFDSAIALNMAMLVNGAILVVSAATFFRAGYHEIAGIQEASHLLEPILGVAVAPVVFAVALLAAGQSATITGTISGQIVMEGFLNIRIPPWVRRLITRLLAVIPAVVVILVAGEESTIGLLVLSQVVLSAQLPFAIVPLVHFASDRRTMGEFAIGRTTRVLAWLVTVVVVGLNVWLLAETLGGQAAGEGTVGFKVVAIPVLVVLIALLVYVWFRPWISRWWRRRQVLASVGIHQAGPSGPGLFDFPLAPYRRVAVALDFSGRDAAVLRETVRFLGTHRPEVALMHVVESAPAGFHGADSGDAESQQDAAQLQAWAAELRALGFTATTHLGAGRPVPELVRLIGEANADLVILGAHGHGFFKDLLLGSTADRLRHRVAAHVLVVAKGSR